MTDRTSVLNAERVQKVFLACLFKDGEDHGKYVPVPGITTNVGFHPGRIEEHKAEIAEMLGELPDEFKESGGGGMSFLNACNDKHGNQWTGMHRAMEQLFQLGLAAGKAACLMPREMWGALPGGMPYYVVNNDFKPVELKAA
jgi:hypothetical protein